MGQLAVTIIFRKKDGFTLEQLENFEKKLILSGRHTYLLNSEKISDVKFLSVLNSFHIENGVSTQEQIFL